MSYRERRVAEVLSIVVRSLNYRVYRWSAATPEASRLVFLLHGWADTGRSFQFLVDALPDDWCIVAPDWRGFGGTDWAPGGYWFPDYLADLDALLQHFSPRTAAILVGHSMGANVALLYAGAEPERVAQVISLEQFGLPDTEPGQAPGRFAQWLQQWREPPVNSIYPDTGAMARRLQMLAPRLDSDRAAWLAPHWCRPHGGGITSLIDPAHKRVNPVLYRRSEAMACWRRITAGTMLALGRESDYFQRYQDGNTADEFRACFRQLHEVVIQDCGHMMHLDQPGATAAAIRSFLDNH